jgi:hypothetical protein
MRDRLIKLQAISGLIFFAFVGVHLMNTWAAAGGAELYDGLQGLAQFLYQAWVVEALILTALGVHVACGIARMKQRRAPTPGRRARWHRYAGIFLMVVVAGHIAAVRGPSWFLDVGWPAAGLARRLPVATAVAALLMVVALASFGGFVGAIDDPFDNDFARLGMGMLNEVF